MELEELYSQGEQLYLDKFKHDLEQAFLGLYAVLDVDSEEYVVGRTKLEAFDKAKERFGEKLFYVVHIGEVNSSTINFKENASFSWVH